MKRALVTGGSGAIGAAICRALANDGLHVVVHANSRPEAAQQLADELIVAGGSAEALCFDVADAQASGAALEKLLEGGAIQVLVNNAGIHQDGILAGMSPQQWHNVIDVSLNGFFNVTQPLLMPMLRTRWGRIINMSSIAGVMGNRGQVNYSAAKAGLIGATKSLAMEVASRNVTVNAVAPGIIESPMISEAFPPETISALVPMKRAGKPEEVAALVSFLASDKAAYLSGQVISINGAMA
ncbi:MAG TPA: 3-oxoacyl-ACP reductase FabG [Gammaproteobacteria bacterium]